MGTTNTEASAGFSAATRILILAALGVLATITVVVFFPQSGSERIKDPNTNDAADESDVNTGVAAPSQNRNTPPVKIAENETPRTAQDRLFYDVSYYSSINEIEIDFTLKQNDAGRQINELTMNVASQNPPLPTPTDLSAAVNGGGIADSWSCSVTGSTISCNGADPLENDALSTFTFRFAQLPDPPEQLTVELLENGSPVTTVMPLLQPSGRQ